MSRYAMPRAGQTDRRRGCSTAWRLGALVDTRLGGVRVPVVEMKTPGVVHVHPGAVRQQRLRVGLAGTREADVDHLDWPGDAAAPDPGALLHRPFALAGVKVDDGLYPRLSRAADKLGHQRDAVARGIRRAALLTRQHRQRSTGGFVVRA